MKKSVFKIIAGFAVYILFAFNAASVLASETKTNVKFEIFSVELNYATRCRTLSFNSGIDEAEMFEQGFKTVPQDKYFNTTLKDGVKILGIEVTDKLAIINFNEEIENNGYGHGPEYSMLKTVANTVGNYYGVGEVLINVEGRPYAGGHGVNPLFKVEPFVDITMSSEEGVYLFQDGEARPAGGESLLLVNGVFTSKYNVIAADGKSYVPLELFGERLGAVTEWSKESGTVEINYGSVRVVVNEPLVIGGEKAYVPVRYVCEQLGMYVGYVPPFHAGQGITQNPVVWIDYYAEPDEAEIENLTRTLRENLQAELDNIGESLKGGIYEAEFNYLYQAVSVIVQSVSYSGRVGHYAIFDGPYTLLVDMETQELYIAYNESGHAGIIKEDMSILEHIWR